MSEQRKTDHIELAFKSQVKEASNYGLYYEPMLASHQENDISTDFLGHKLSAPFWVSSMTGGAAKAKLININLAKMCAKFGLGMGLGSCRPLLESEKRIDDFKVRKYIGDQPLFANIGIAQLEELIEQSKLYKIDELIKKLECNGLIIHVNPLQEALQPEGDKFSYAPIKTIEKVCNDLNISLIIKEVGQGMGPMSLKALLDLPIDGIEFAGLGGTNFSLLEHARHTKSHSCTSESLKDFAFVGHNLDEMINWVNALFDQNSSYLKKHFILSGGVKNIIHAHALKERFRGNSIIGFASKYLKYALEGEESLDEFMQAQIKAYQLSINYLKG